MLPHYMKPIEGGNILDTCTESTPLTMEKQHSILQRHVPPSSLDFCNERVNRVMKSNTSKLFNNHKKPKEDQGELTVKDFPAEWS